VYGVGDEIDDIRTVSSCNLPQIALGPVDCLVGILPLLSRIVLHRFDELPPGQNRLGNETGDLVSVPVQPAFSSIEHPPCPTGHEGTEAFHTPVGVVVLGQLGDSRSGCGCKPNSTRPEKPDQSGPDPSWISGITRLEGIGPTNGPVSILSWGEPYNA